MGRSAGRSAPKVLLSLADDDKSTPVASDWIGPLFLLGTRLARKASNFGGRQLIVTISVPSREYSAALIGAGWTIGRPPTTTETDPLRVLRRAVPGASYRAVNGSYVISGHFRGLDETRTLPRVSLSGQWGIQGLEAVAPVALADPAERMLRPQIGSIGRMTGIDRDWAQRLAAPAADLVLVGTQSWIEQDINAVLSRGDDTDGDSLANLLLPRTEKTATSFSRIYSSSGFADKLPLPDHLGLTVLDGQRAIRYINDVLTPIVVCIFDRSIADESAAELIVQLRNSRGEPISLTAELEWSPPPGIEALGFTVGL